MSVKINHRFVKMLLVRRNMTLLDLARESAIGQATLYRIVNDGAAFRSETLGKLATALECSPVDLIEVDGYAPPLVGAPSGSN